MKRKTRTVTESVFNCELERSNEKLKQISTVFSRRRFPGMAFLLMGLQAWLIKITPKQ
jgi:hypothetical protein